MKKNFRFTIQILATCILFLLSACSKDGSNKKTETYTIYTNPVYTSKSDVLASINGNASMPIKHAGKFYVKGNFIYLNDVNKGIHIIDNSNAAHPVQIAFLSIPGNLDIAIKNNILYADMYSDLLALDISNPRQVKITKTLNSFFTGRIYFGNFPAYMDDKIITDWQEKDTTVTINDDIISPGGCNGCVFETLNNASKSYAGGVAGSMASMVLMDNYLYAITEMHSLGIADVSNAAHPKSDSSFFAGFDLETIYPFKNQLFLGSSVGMFMYDVSNPEHPTPLGEFEHGTACDPVITDGDYAYVTLHSGSFCGGAQNELDVVDVKNITNSALVKTYNLTKPTGLCKDENLLFVCDDNEVKVFDASNPAGLVLLQQIQSNQPYDVIAANKKMIVVNADGISQYDYSNIFNIRLLSFISAKR